MISPWFKEKVFIVYFWLDSNSDKMFTATFDGCYAATLAIQLFANLRVAKNISKIIATIFK